MATTIQAQVNNPITGVFGSGQIQIFSSSGTWVVPPGVAKVRVRLWGAGGSYCGVSLYYAGGGGGGFALKAIYNLSGVTSVPVTVGVGVIGVAPNLIFSTSGTSSFGSFVSATGGSTGGTAATSNIGGTGIGGDINTTGGLSGWGGSNVNTSGGGGSASLFGNGGSGGNSGSGGSSLGGAGGGSGTQNVSCPGGLGYLGVGGIYQGAYSPPVPATSGLNPFSIDFIGTGGGAAYGYYGSNGGGGGASSSSAGNPGLPGGGSGCSNQGFVVNGTTVYGAPGLVIVEW